MLNININTNIEKAVQHLLNGDLVAFPTETVYGLGADATNEIAVAKIFAVKKRPKNHPLIVHLPNISALDFWADERKIPAFAIEILQTFSPGPITLILPRNSKNVGDFITGGQSNVGIRIPNHPLALDLLQEFQRKKSYGGISAPSANLFGRISPTTANDVQNEIGDQISMILDGGACQIGIESTILDCCNGQPQILRPGHISETEINKILQKYHLHLNQNSNKNTTRVSGSLPGHYAPKTPMQIFDNLENLESLKNLSNPSKNIAVICFEDVNENNIQQNFIKVKYCQKMPLNATLYANLLYKVLRNADTANVETIFIQKIPNEISWNAVADRIQRAVNGSGK